MALTGEQKEKEMAKLLENCPDVVRAIMTHASVDDVTRAGFFDRKNQTLSYVDGRVALLGDAVSLRVCWPRPSPLILSDIDNQFSSYSYQAHPQSPMMGQGANMAIVDGFVAAQRLAAAMQAGTAIEQALVDYDCETRRKNNTKVIFKARRYGQWGVSRNRFVVWFSRTMVKYMPASAIVNEVSSGDKSNQKFVKSLKRDLGETIGSTSVSLQQ